MGVASGPGIFSWELGNYAISMFSPNLALAQTKTLANIGHVWCIGIFTTRGHSDQFRWGGIISASECYHPGTYSRGDRIRCDTSSWL